MTDSAVSSSAATSFLKPPAVSLTYQNGASIKPTASTGTRKAFPARMAMQAPRANSTREAMHTMGNVDIRPDAAGSSSQPGEDAVAHFCGGYPQHHKKPGDHANTGDQLDHCHAVSSFLWMNCSSSPQGIPFSIKRRCRLSDISSHFWWCPSMMNRSPSRRFSVMLYS